MSTSRTYRTRDQWQAILDEFTQTDLSAPKFCQQQQIPYGSFSKWRSKLSAKENTQATPGPGPFVDLSALRPQSSVPWRITLKLGNDVELLLSQT